MEPEILVIDLSGFTDPVVAAGAHVHLCPICYAYVGCEYACSCPEDLTLTNGTPCGSTAPCLFCEVAQREPQP
jgi:hypothetical protein